jgi:hypothetical protein
MAKRPMTNEEKLTHMMRYSNFGAIKQCFIMEAIRKWAEIISKATPEQVENGFISGTAWIGVAKETLKDISTDMTINDPELDDEDEQDDFDPENIYGSASMRQSVEEDRKRR